MKRDLQINKENLTEEIKARVSVNMHLEVEEITRLTGLKRSDILRTALQDYIEFFKEVSNQN